MPREVEPGMEVISGCINQTGILTICTTKEFGESTVSKILDLVENSSMKKSKSENLLRSSQDIIPRSLLQCSGTGHPAPVINLIMGNPAAWST